MYHSAITMSQSPSSHDTSNARTAVSNNDIIRRDRPCDACRRRKMRCHPTTDVNACILCQSHSQSCSFVQDPPRKKRRVEPTSEARSPSLTNGRYVNPPHSKPRTLLLTPCFYHSGKLQNLPLVCVLIFLGCRLLKPDSCQRAIAYQ